MTEQEVKKEKTKVRVINLTKLVVALGALTAAINAYVQVRKDQNNLLEVMSDKVDAIVLKVAYLEGRIEGLSPKDAATEATKRVQPAPAPAPAGLPLKVTVAAPPEPPPPMPTEEPTAMTKHDTVLYRQMPRSFDAVQMVVQQKLDKIDGPQPAAPVGE